MFTAPLPPSILLSPDPLGALDDIETQDSSTADVGKAEKNVHIRVQQRNGRKSLTTIQGLDPNVRHRIRMIVLCHADTLARNELFSVHRVTVGDIDEIEMCRWPMADGRCRSSRCRRTNLRPPPQGTKSIPTYHLNQLVILPLYFTLYV